jgi:hypothetical protein
VKKFAVITLVVLFAFCVTVNAFAENATKEEVTAKCKEAAEMVKADKAAGIAEIGKKRREICLERHICLCYGF